MFYTATDNLGSINLIVDGTTGDIVDDLSYDVWGRFRNPNDWTYDNITLSSITDRGYTGHEHMTAFSLINMNGRVYDPYTSQFLSPDPFIQDPTNPQNYNRYSYVLNNPLKFTDQSGYNFQVYDSNCGCFRDENAYTGFAGWYNWYMKVSENKEATVYGPEHRVIASGPVGDFLGQGWKFTVYGKELIKETYGVEPEFHNGKWGYYAEHTYSPNVPKFGGSNTTATGRTFVPFYREKSMGGAGGSWYEQYGFVQEGDKVMNSLEGFGEHTINFFSQRTYTDVHGFQWNVNSSGYISGMTPNMGFPPVPAFKGGGTHLVYQGFNKAGVVKYVGITSRNATVRFGEHLSTGTAKSLLRYEVVPGATNFSWTGARVREQTLINQHGLNNLLNVRNSIAPKYWFQYGIKP